MFTIPSVNLHCQRKYRQFDLPLFCYNCVLGWRCKSIRVSNHPPPLKAHVKQFNSLPHGVLATFSLMAGGLMSTPIEDNISRETTFLITSLRTHKTSAVSSPGLHCTYLPPPPLAPLGGHCVHYLAPLFTSQLSRQLFKGKRVYIL